MKTKITTETPTPEQRRELLELEKKATPRPWHWEPEYGNVNTTPDPESDHILCGCCWHAKDDPDYLYAVAAANIAPGLVREVERLRESNAAKQKLLDEADVLIGQQLSLSEKLVRYEMAFQDAPHAPDCHIFGCEHCAQQRQQHYLVASTAFCWQDTDSDTFFVPMKCNCWKDAPAAGKETE